MLIDYLSFRLLMMKHELIQKKFIESDQATSDWPATINEETKDGGGGGGGGLNGVHPAPVSRLEKLGKIELNSPRMKRASKHVQKLKMGESKDDIHVSIMCLRAIMNNKYGFNLVIKHNEAITCIALSLNHKSLRTKALVLELLAAICLVKGLLFVCLLVCWFVCLFVCLFLKLVLIKLKPIKRFRFSILNVRNDSFISLVSIL